MKNENQAGEGLLQTREICFPCSRISEFKDPSTGNGAEDSNEIFRTELSSAGFGPA